MDIISKLILIDILFLILIWLFIIHIYFLRKRLEALETYGKQWNEVVLMAVYRISYGPYLWQGKWYRDFGKRP